MKAPRRGVRSPPRLELSGSKPSHEPHPSRSVNWTEKATSWQRTTGPTATATAAKPGVFAERMRKDVSAEASEGALLQRRMSAQGEAVVAMEKPTAMAPFGERPEETTATKPSSSRTVAHDWTGTIRHAWVITNRSLRIFFGATCDRPGCYERFQPTRRSPLQRFCSQECRRALERVWERERRWKKRGPGRIVIDNRLAARSAALRL